MEYRNLGNSGLKVSEISLGSWISFKNSNDIEIPKSIIHKAYETGINFFDTANGYQGGEAESILGKVLSDFSRDSYVVATKVYWPVGPEINNRGLSRKHIFSQVEKSLERLRTDYIDVYYCHWYDSETPLEETLCAMDDLVKKGVIRYYGVSNWTAAQIAYGLYFIEKYNLYKITTNQPSYSLLDRYIEEETIPLCTREGIGQVVYSPLAQGVLTGKYTRKTTPPKGSRALNPLAKGEVSIRDFLTDPILECVEKLKIIAQNNSLSLTEMSLAWIMQNKNVSSAIVGASNPEQVVMNSKASGIILTAEIIEEIEQVLNECSFTLKHNIVPW